MKFTIETMNDNGSGMKYRTKEEFMKEISLMIDDATRNGATYFDIQVDSDASCFYNEEDENEEDDVEPEQQGETPLTPDWRLTRRNEFGVGRVCHMPKNRYGDAPCYGCVDRTLCNKNLFERLAQYEDTGLTPEDVAKLAAGGEKKEELKEKVREILASENSEDMCEQITAAVSELSLLEDESWNDTGRRLLEAFLENDADGVLMALCGWSIKSVMIRAGLLPDDEGVFSSN